MFMQVNVGTYMKRNHVKIRTQVNNDYQDFQEASKNLPPDMKILIDQLIKILSTKST